MPTYEYKCESCRHELEVFQSMNDKPKRKCPECGKNTLRRLIGTGAAVLFKGSGFYETDYRSPDYKKAAEKDSKPASESKTQTKPDKPSDAKTPESDTKKAPTANTDTKPSKSKSTGD